MAFTFGGATYDDPPVDEWRYRMPRSNRAYVPEDSRTWTYEPPPRSDIYPPAQHPGLVDVDLTEPPPVNVIPYTRVLVQKIERLEAENARLDRACDYWKRRALGAIVPLAMDCKD